LLSVFAAHIDGERIAAVLGSPDQSGGRSGSGISGQVCRNTGTSEQPIKRSFGRKYKTDDYAKYYADKHDSTLMRRASNYLERRMIARALNRIRRRGPFKSVLDCPSGAGRLLPTLADFNVSVVAMDTSGTMLREGFRHYDLFSDTPRASVGSAFALPLADDAVDVVLCSRLLHHIPERADRMKILREFARVARVGVVISFFDAASYGAWKRRRKIEKKGKPSGRHALRRTECQAEAREAGLISIGMNALIRYHAEVTAASFLV
jgi:ubiquinone/menaquinone biosynthesis C-methylase UbiE